MVYMATKYHARKLCKKQRRCEAIIARECGIESSDDPTHYLAVLNAGLATGLTEEVVLNAASAHGEVTQLVMIPGKSYCFISCPSDEDGQRIYTALHGQANIGQKGAVVYIGYFKQLPAQAQDIWQKPLPQGLVLIEDFVTAIEEAGILRALTGSPPETAPLQEHSGGTLKHRRVQHFGYEFVYGSNNVDPTQPLAVKIPTVCDVIWPRFEQEAAQHDIAVEWRVPDQLTVNSYAPGQGIPPHVDTHSAFLDPILSLSLEGDVVMDFRRGSERVPVYLPRRSLLIMSGESRYDWTHGITPRTLDVVAGASGALTTKPRTCRTSLTFRRLRRGPCNCGFPALCDTRLAAKSQPDTAQVLSAVAADLEVANVHQVYDQIALHFSETRHTPWPQVSDFLQGFEDGAVILDVGCGNGKYLRCAANALTIGCDRSLGLLDVCQSNGSSVFRCDCLQLPVRAQCIDGCISIAVIHHLSTIERRLAAVREMARVLRKGGRALIYVWAKDQRGDSQKSSYLRQNKAINKCKATEDQQRQQTLLRLGAKPHSLVDLPIHTNRTDFLQQDVLVPWKLKAGAKASVDRAPPETFLRYYHVFEQEELARLVAQVPEVELLRSYYDQGNHCVIFQKQ